MRRHEFEQQVDRVIEELPAWVLDELDNVIVVVEDHPDPPEAGLLGLYDGVSKAERDFYSGVMPDRIVIYYQPHIELGLDITALQSEIRKTVLHEIAHHLGISDDRLTELGWD